MGFMDDALNQGEKLLHERSDQAKKGVESVGDLVNEKTGGKFENLIEKAENLAEEQIDRHA